MSAPLPSLRVLHVEDEAHKARAVARIARMAATLLDAEVEIVHVASVAAALTIPGGSIAFDAVISDWQIPLRDGEGPSNVGGSAVVAWALLRDLPVLVVSGSDRPSSFVESARCRWAEAHDWLACVRWLLGLALGRGERLERRSA